MNKVLNIFKILTLAAVITLCVYIAIFVHKLTSVDTTAINAVTTNLNLALGTINRPQTGSLAEINKTLLAMKSSLVHADLILDHENRQLTTLDSQEHQLFSDVHTTLHQGQETMIAAQESLAGASSLFATTETTITAVQPVLSHLDATVISSNQTVTKFNALFFSPETTATLKNVDKITFHAANIMDTADQVSTKATHSYLHPSTNPWARGWDASSPYILPILKIAGSLAP